jgi:hypothetical protein
MVCVALLTRNVRDLEPMLMAGSHLVKGRREGQTAATASLRSDGI